MWRRRKQPDITFNIVCRDHETELLPVLDNFLNGVFTAEERRTHEHALEVTYGQLDGFDDLVPVLLVRCDQHQESVPLAILMTADSELYDRLNPLKREDFIFEEEN